MSDDRSPQPLRFGWLSKRILRILRILGADFFALALTYLGTRSISEAIIVLRKIKHRIPEAMEPSGSLPHRGYVVLAQGYDNDRQGLSWIAEKLLRLGFSVYCLKNAAKKNRDTFEEILRLNEDLIGSLARRYEEKPLPIVCVGFSKGGCDLAHWARALWNRTKTPIQLLVTVNSPINGSRIAQFARYPGAWGLIKGSDAVRETLKNLTELQVSGTEIKSFCSMFDEVVRRRDSRLPGAWAETLPHLGHWGPLQNPWALDIIVAYIQHALHLL